MPFIDKIFKLGLLLIMGAAVVLGFYAVKAYKVANTQKRYSLQTSSKGQMILIFDGNTGEITQGEHGVVWQGNDIVDRRYQWKTFNPVK